MNLKYLYQKINNEIDSLKMTFPKIWDFALEKSENISAFILKIRVQFESIVCWDLLPNNI